METTKKLNETPLNEKKENNQAVVVVDEDGNVSRVEEPVDSIPDDYIGGLK